MVMLLIALVSIRVSIDRDFFRIRMISKCFKAPVGIDEHNFVMFEGLECY